MGIIGWPGEVGRRKVEGGAQRCHSFVTEGLHLRRDFQDTIFGEKLDDLLLHLGGPTPLGNVDIAIWPGHYGPTT